MKRLYLDNSLGIIVVPIATFPLAWVCNKWLQGKSSYNKRIH